MGIGDATSAVKHPWSRARAPSRCWRFRSSAESSISRYRKFGGVTSTGSSSEMNSRASSRLNLTLAFKRLAASAAEERMLVSFLSWSATCSPADTDAGMWWRAGVTYGDAFGSRVSMEGLAPVVVRNGAHADANPDS